MSLKQSLTYFFYWISNIALKILKLKKRDKNLWLFGAWRGKTYSDNSKYLFEYVSANLPEVEAVWITKNRAVKKMLEQEGRRCYLAGERRARQLRLKAGVVFFTNGMHDFGDFDLCQGALKVALWHGMPLKKLYFATNYFKEDGFKRSLERFILKAYNKAERDISIATSEKAKKFIETSFRAKPKDILITGQPRNDVLFESSVAEQTKAQLNHPQGYTFVLYMPTWRETGEYGAFFENNSSFLDNVIRELNSDPGFIKALNRHNTILYIKPHPNRSVQATESENIRILEKSDGIDAPGLMAAADMLITDYSSVFIDFALTGKPVHFYVPDLDQYRAGTMGLFLNFEDFAKFWFDDLSRFKKAVLNQGNSHKSGLENTDQINEIYNEPTLKKGHYSAELLKALQSYLN